MPRLIFAARRSCAIESATGTSTDTGDGARRSNADELFILVLTALWAHRVPAPHGERAV